MFGVNTTEYQSIYLTIATLLVIGYLAYRWWIKQKQIRFIPKIIVIPAAGFIFYKLVIYTATGILFLGYTAKDHLFSETQDATIIDFKMVKSKPKGSLTYPVVKYQDQNGREKVATVDSGFGGADTPKLYETVKIVVDEKNDQVRLITYLKTMTIVGWLLLIFFGIVALTGITEYALTLHFENARILIIVGSTYIIIPLMIAGAAFFFGKSAYDNYIHNNFSRVFWIHASITGGCLLFIIGYINILREQYQKSIKKRKR